MLLALTTKEVLKVFSLRGQKRRKFEAGTVIYQTKKGIHTTAIYNCIKRKYIIYVDDGFSFSSFF